MSGRCEVREALGEPRQGVRASGPEAGERRPLVVAKPAADPPVSVASPRRGRPARGSAGPSGRRAPNRASRPASATPRPSSSGRASGRILRARPSRPSRSCALPPRPGRRPILRSSGARPGPARISAPQAPLAPSDADAEPHVGLPLVHPRPRRWRRAARSSPRAPRPRPSASRRRPGLIS